MMIIYLWNSLRMVVGGFRTGTNIWFGNGNCVADMTQFAWIDWSTTCWIAFPALNVMGIWSHKLLSINFHVKWEGHSSHLPPWTILLSSLYLSQSWQYFPCSQNQHDYRQTTMIHDPLTIRPPPYESTEERNERLRMEQAAKATSDNIDADLEKLVMSEKRGPKPIKILLLGASLTKSFVTRNF